MAASSSPPLVMTAGPLLLGFFFNLFLYGVLVVQVYLYYIGFPKDRWWFKALVYGVFILEVTQVIQCHDKFDLYAKEFGVIVSLEKLRFSWFSIAILSSLTGGIVQAFQAWRIYTFSKTWFISIGIWILTLLATAGIAQGIVSVHLTVPQIVTNTKTTGIIWFTTTAINDVGIAGILTYYLNRLKSGDKKTQKLLSKIIRLTVETGSITALGAIIIMITVFTIPPWFYMISDCIGKLYANNLMVMFNSRLTVGHRSQSSELNGDGTQLSTFRANSHAIRTISSDVRAVNVGEYSSKNASLPHLPAGTVNLSKAHCLPFHVEGDHGASGW
ncbi:hypothetical protein DL96DRAFT_896902 [Flagelloscypha sp. PMI_526]|nr:hypothetical protein DL96DRAFT_896902 [Flagelloscypha sp. PMI_526]